MRSVLIILLFLHGLIHLMGFAKAFGFAEINALSQYISKSYGLVWLFSSLLLLSTSILLFLKKDWWPFLALIAVILSQLLIIIFWKDAKFGTLVNILVLFASLSGLGEYQFTKMVSKETLGILNNTYTSNLTVIQKSDAKHLPEIIQKWLANSKAFGKENFGSVRLRQKGEIKTSPDNKWMPFTAQQYFNLQNPSFVWITHVKPMPLVFMKGRDKLINGKGHMTIKLFSFIPVVNLGNNEKINSASMQRYLAEMCWFPTAALNDHIIWQSIDQTSAKATITIDGKSVSGIFEFTNVGEFTSFETYRYYGGGQDATLEKWFIEPKAFKEFEGIKIPYKCSVSWLLKKGKFNWLNLEITNLDYNKPIVFQ